MALKLSQHQTFDIKLISDKPYFEYHAALYRSATGRSPLEVAIPLRDFFNRAKNVEVAEDKITGIDASAQTADGSSGSVWRYDSLILAVGNVSNYFGIEGLQKYSHSIKTIQEALAFKRHIHQAAGSKRFVVIGGGPSGVELAAELPSYIRHVRKKHNLKPGDFEVRLIEAKDRVLPGLPGNFTARITKRLENLGVDITLNAKVQGETAHSLKVNGRNIDAEVVVWTAGTKPNPLLEKSSIPLTRRGLAEVDKTMRAYKNIYALGDTADTRFSGMAQTAIDDANQLAKNLISLAKGKKPRAYEPHKPIYAIPVGPRWSAVLWNGKCIYGLAGWVLRRLADLRLYLRLLSPRKSLTAWRYGLKREEVCSVCLQKL